MLPAFKLVMVNVGYWLHVLSRCNAAEVVSEWSEWSACDADCRRHRHRRCQGTACDDGLDLQSEHCPSHLCGGSLSSSHADDEGGGQQAVHNPQTGVCSPSTSCPPQRLLTPQHPVVGNQQSLGEPLTLFFSFPYPSLPSLPFPLLFFPSLPFLEVGTLNAARGTGGALYILP